MKIEQFPEEIRPYLIPEPKGQMFYKCLGCDTEFGIDQLLYACPDCGSVLLLHNRNSEHLKEKDGVMWRKIFDYRRMLNYQPLNGIFRYYEFIAPIIPLEQIIYLGEGHTPIVRPMTDLETWLGWTSISRMTV